MNMNDFIQRLPLDIILQIIPYTYNLQKKDLLNDIIDYKVSRSILLELYHKYWIIEGQMQDPEEDINWLINDIFAYANNDKAIMYGYIDNFYTIFKRNISLQTKEEIDKYVNKLEEKKVKTQINIFLGLLTIQERNDLLTIFYSKLRQYSN
jgi:hypothetical protein